MALALHVHLHERETEYQQAFYLGMHRISGRIIRLFWIPGIQPDNGFDSLAIRPETGY
jgi:hypothetical protein